MSNVDLVRSALTALQSQRYAEAAKFWAPGFTLHSNGKSYDFAATVAMLRERQARINKAQASFVDIFSKGDRVASWRTASLSTKAGTQAPAIVLIDVWQVKDGLIIAGEQCWQLMRLFAGDDMAMSPQEAVTAEAVWRALERLADLASVQETLGRCWAEKFVGHVDGVRMDLAALCQHWATLQAVLASLAVEIKELVVHGPAVGAVYHLLATKKDGGKAELRLAAVFGINKGGKIASCEAVSQLVSGSTEDEQLATLMPAA